MALNGAIFVGIGGSVAALDRATGEEIWRTKLRSNDFVNVTLNGEDLYAAVRGEIYSLDPTTGAVRWKNALKGLGWGLVTIAGAGSQSVVAQESRRRAAEAAATSATT